ncbi:MAG: hypothetical protein HUU18_12080 [Phycisphaerales bacterium]|nr:hypothetical protein [Phycisphaerales bacterium]
MKKLIVGALTGMMACVSAAQAQCSSWDNTMSIASVLGDPNNIIETFLSNNAIFVYSANSTDGVLGFTADGNGIKWLEFWDEDEDGTAYLFDSDGNMCTVACTGNGGILVTIVGLGFDSLTWDVKADATISMPGDVCGCSYGAGSASQNVKCTTANCSAYVRCRPGTPGGYCQNGTNP